MSLYRLNLRLPRVKAKPGIMQGTADVSYQIADAHLPEAFRSVMLRQRLTLYAYGRSAADEGGAPGSPCAAPA